MKTTLNGGKIHSEVMLVDSIQEKYNKIQGDFYFESFKSDSSMPLPHYHENYEFYFLISGKCEYHFSTMIHTLNPGDVIVTEPYVPHRVIYDLYQEENKRFLFNVHPKHLLKYYSAEVVDSFFKNINMVSKFSLDKADCDMLMKFSKELDFEERKNDGRLSYIPMGNILSVISKYHNADADIKSKSTKSPHIDRIIDYMNTHIDSHITLDILEKELYISKKTINDLFKKNFNMTPSAYLSKLRIQNAIFLLAKSNYSVAKISTLCGFSTNFYFSKIFKSNTGYTPSEFRKQIEKKEGF